MAITDKPSVVQDLSSRLAGSDGRGEMPGPVVQFMALGAVGALVVLGMSWAVIGLSVAVLLGVFAYALGLGVAVAALRAHYPHGVIGWCNAVTLLRMALACVLIAALLAPAPPWAVWVIATAAFAMDGIDGWLARRAHLSSAFGARFDMEVDAVLALTLAVLVYQSGSVGTYVLLLGLPRYVFWCAQTVWPWLAGDLPDRFSRKVVCVLQIGTLLALLLPFVGPPISGLLAGSVAAALIWSFGIDVRLLWRTRG